MGDQDCDILLCGQYIPTIFNSFYEHHLNCVFSVHAICTEHNYCKIVTHTLRLSGKNTFSCALVIRLLLLLPLSQLRFLFTNELSASGIVVLCTGQKFINVSHKNATSNTRLGFFQESNGNRSKIKKAEL